MSSEFETDVEQQRSHAEDNGVLSFDLEREEIPVKLGGRDCKLVEMDGQEKDKYLKAENNKMKVDGSGNRHMNDFNDSHALLISYCLRDENGDRVPVAVIRDYPSKVQMKLHQECMILNGFSKREDEEEGKNS